MFELGSFLGRKLTNEQGENAVFDPRRRTVTNRQTLATNHKRMAVHAVAAASLGIFLISCGKLGQGSPPVSTTSLSTTWTITVKVTNGVTKPTYAFTASPDASHNGCSFATSASGVYPANHLEVCSGDVVQWQGDSGGRPHDLVIFVSDRILIDGSGNPLTTIFASNGNPTAGGNVSTSAAKKVDHEWYVTLVDKQTNETHYDDPKIIIGK